MGGIAKQDSVLLSVLRGFLSYQTGSLALLIAAWIQRQRWEALTPAERCKFPLIAPDFVIELRSATDALPMLQEKMQQYLNAGLRLAGLINPQQQQVEIDRLRQTPATRHLPTELSGEDVLPEFSLNLDPY